MNIMKAMTLIVLLTLMTFTMAMNRDRLGKQTTLLNIESAFDQDAKRETQDEKFHHKTKRSNGNGMRMKGNGMFKKFQKQGAFIPPGQYRHMLQQQQLQSQLMQQHPQPSYPTLQPQTILLQTMPVNGMQLQPQLQQQPLQFQTQLQQQAYVVDNQAPIRRQVQVQPQVMVVGMEPQLQPQLQPQPLPLSRPQLPHHNHVNIIQQQQPQDTVILIKQLPTSHPQQVYQVQTFGHQQHQQHQQQQQQQQQQQLQQFQPQPPLQTLPVNIQQNNIVVTTTPQNRFRTTNGQHSIEQYEQQQLIAQITETIKNDQQNEAASTIPNKQNQNDVEIFKNSTQSQTTHQAIITQPATPIITTTTVSTATAVRTTPNPRLYDLLYGSNLNNEQQQQQQQQRQQVKRDGNEFGIDPRIK